MRIRKKEFGIGSQEHFYFYSATYPELLKQFRQSLAVTLPLAFDIAL
jgi:hypothetical protein